MCLCLLHYLQEKTHMTPFIFLLFITLHGITLVEIFNLKNKMVALSSGFIFGTLLCVSGIYWLSCLTHSLDSSLIVFFIASLILFAKFFKKYLTSIQLILQMTKKEWGMITILFLFSYYLFAKSFGYDSVHGNFLVASNVYLDFGAHIPFIRSFSLGSNFPGEVPFFGNSGLLYYFLFDFFGGVVEHLGLNIALAYNLISALSFTALLLMTYQLALLIFKNKKVGVLSVLFFLFSSNLSFLTFFQKYGLHPTTISAWWHNNFYFEGQPTLFNKAIEVSGFLNLNPYINQRHLVFGVPFFLCFLYILLFFQESKKSITAKGTIFLGILLGLLVMWHTMVFIALGMVGVVALLVYPSIRKQLFITLCIGALVGLPQILLIKLHSANTIVFKPGFLLENMLTIKNEVTFWSIDLGLGLITIIGGFFVSTREQKKFFYILLPLFIIPNLIHLSSRFTFDDHKYFNVWILGMGMFSAVCMTRLYNKNVFGKISAIVATIFLVLSGLISIMVIKNDIFTILPDYPKNALLTYVKMHIPNNQIILTNGEIYDPITLLGKKTFVGRVQYIYVYGGDASKRLATQQILLQPDSYSHMIQEAQKNKLQYFVFYKNNFAKNEKPFNENFYNHHATKLYEDHNGVIYKI